MLETYPALKEKIRLGGTLINERRQLETIVHDVSYRLETDNDDKAYLIASVVVHSYQNKFWYVHGLSDLGTPEFVKPAKHFKTNYSGGWNEVLNNELKTAIFLALEADGVRVYGIEISNRLHPLSSDENCLFTSIDGEVVIFRTDIVHEEGYRETCDTCQMGMTLIFNELQRIDSKAVFFEENKVDSKIVLDSGEILRLHDDLNYMIVQSDNGSSRLERLKNWFFLANAGAVEMARIKTINFIGV